MKRYDFLLACLVLAILLGNSISCRKKSEQAQSDEASSRNTDTAASEPNDVDQNTGNLPAPSGNKMLCETITPEDLQKITGAEYATTSSQADFTNIKHCDYSSEDLKFVISLTIAFGETANQRMEQNKKVPGTKQVAGFGDEATWEPLQGTFTARFKDRCVDIKVSEAHGDDEKRIGQAKEIANLVLENF